MLRTLHVREPVWLVVVLRGDGQRVEEHQEDHQPVEGGGFHRQATLPAAEPVPAAPVPTARSQRGQSSHVYKHHNTPATWTGRYMRKH